jgi:FMN phosphatase YigB (HAD superfamily)
MTKKLAILFDLDDTLLINDMNHFLPGYMNALSSAIPAVQPDLLNRALLSGTDKMLSKNMPAHTLEETFNDVFYPKLGINQETYKNAIDLFYKKDFPSLQYLTKTRLESATIINEVHKAGHAITIATSPLFPYPAQIHRLHWAGIDISQNYIDEVTSFENYHFCKPHPEFFIEVILKNNYQNLPVVMIGNSLADDILPCEKLGIPTYWVTDHQKNNQQGNWSAAGDLSGCLQWIENISNELEPIKWNNTLENALSFIKTTPTVFDDYCKRYPDPIIFMQQNGTKHSIVKILRHIIEGDKQLNIPRIRQFYNESKPIITGMDLDALSKFSDYANNDYCHLLSQFIEIRTELLELIIHANQEVTSKMAMHTIFGPTSFSEIIEFIGIHDLSHLQECGEILNHLSK